MKSVYMLTVVVLLSACALTPEQAARYRRVGQGLEDSAAQMNNNGRSNASSNNDVFIKPVSNQPKQQNCEVRDLGGNRYETKCQ